MGRQNETEDPQRPSDGSQHDVREMLVVAIAAILADCGAIAEISEWDLEHEPRLRRSLFQGNGVASSDTFERLFRIPGPKHPEQVFRRWVGDLASALNGVVAIDGNCGHGSGGTCNPLLHVVCACMGCWCASTRWVAKKRLLPPSVPVKRTAADGEGQPANMGTGRWRLASSARTQGPALAGTAALKAHTGAWSDRSPVGSTHVVRSSRSGGPTAGG